MDMMAVPEGLDSISDFEYKGDVQALLASHRLLVARCRGLVAENAALRAAANGGLGRPSSDAQCPDVGEGAGARIDPLSDVVTLEVPVTASSSPPLSSSRPAAHLASKGKKGLVGVCDGVRVVEHNHATSVARAEVAGVQGSESTPVGHASSTFVSRSTSVTSMFIKGVVRPLMVIDQFSNSAECFVHEGVLNKLPYFANRAGKWGSDGTEKLWLPNCCSHSSFSAVMCRLYSVDEHWTQADWTRIMGAELTVAYGALLLLKMLLATDIVQEVLAVIRHTASDASSVAWLRQEAICLDIQELEGFCVASDQVALDATALQQAALNTMKGSTEGRQLLKTILATREKRGLAPGDAAALISVLADHCSYMTRGCTHSVGRARVRHGAVVGTGRAYRVSSCDFFRPFRIPIDSFGWLWQMVEEQVDREPELFQSATAVFKALQWLEYDVSANRRGHESAAGSHGLRHLPEGPSKQAIRRAFASFLLLGLRLLHRGHICQSVFLEAFSCGTLSSSQAPEGLVGTRRNLLHFQSYTQRFCPNYVDSVAVVAVVLSNISDGARDSILAMVPNFSDWQSAFTPSAVRSLSDEQQIACVAGCTQKWLTGEVCAALRGEASASARAKLSLQVGGLSSAQREFLKKTE
eukprot:TRINITY_DN6687_c0_g1_i1.p1 TRINITY_DN6687_c0_g1~~TRINITY_DN6687_c0_g1_i1.p1  ORF type:complete len:638 (+),score=77.30 TRINITY_DN6687_c0_g1_i1:197-2110(+)